MRQAERDREIRAAVVRGCELIFAVGLHQRARVFQTGIDTIDEPDARADLGHHRRMKQRQRQPGFERFALFLLGQRAICVVRFLQPFGARARNVRDLADETAGHRDRSGQRDLHLTGSERARGLALGQRGRACARDERNENREREKMRLDHLPTTTSAAVRTVFGDRGSVRAVAGRVSQVREIPGVVQPMDRFWRWPPLCTAANGADETAATRPR
jgi:hypothetical protein